MLTVPLERILHKCPTPKNHAIRKISNPTAQQLIHRQFPLQHHLLDRTFTVPEELRAVIASKPKEWLALLFDASSSSLTDLCQNPKWFGAIPGITGVLHTWSRAMIYHPHIHYLVTGGGFDQTGAWRWPKNGFLVPAHALSRVYRERFKAGLKN